jgi:hypothetical protein
MRLEQCIDDRTLRNVAAFALGRHGDKHSFQAAEVGDLLSDISGVANSDLTNLGARVPVAIDEPQQPPDFV